MAGPSADWDLIRDEYVAGPDTLTIAALIKKHGCGKAVCYKRAAVGKWTRKRSEHRKKVAVETSKKAIDLQISIRTKHIAIAQKMQEKALAKLEKLRPESLEADEMRRLLKDSAEMERRAVGIPDVQEHRVDVSKLTDEELRAIVDGTSKRGA